MIDLFIFDVDKIMIEIDLITNKNGEIFLSQNSQKNILKI